MTFINEGWIIIEEEMLFIREEVIFIGYDLFFYREEVIYPVILSGQIHCSDGWILCKKSGKLPFWKV
jgi:hypothetical protein